MKITFRGVLAIILAVILSYLAVYFVGLYRGKKQTSNILNTGWQLTQDSLKTAMVELKSSDEMIVTLMSGGKEQDRKLKVNAATICDLSAKLAKVQGGGAAVRDTGGWAAYQDRYLTAFFRMDPDTISYSLAVRPIKVSLVEDLNNTWSAWAWDVLDDVPVPIDSLAIQRNKDFSPAKPWYRKLATFAKYTGVAVVGGSAGYLAGRIMK